MPNTHSLSDSVDFSQLLAPASRGAGGATGAVYIDMRGYDGGVVIIDVGALGASATLDGALKQATSSAGAGTKAISGATITQLTQATNDGSNALYGIEFRTTQLDLANGFYFVQITGTVATAASLFSALLVRFRGRTHVATSSLVQRVKV
jgi:hypothetical protein